MSLKDYTLEDADFSIVAQDTDDYQITLSANDYDMYTVQISVNDVIEMAKHFNLTEEDLK